MKVFSPKWSLLLICENFLPRKFPSIRYIIEYYDILFIAGIDLVSMVSGLTIGKPDDASSIADSAIATSIGFTEMSRYSEVSFLKMITPCPHACTMYKG